VRADALERPAISLHLVIEGRHGLMVVANNGPEQEEIIAERGGKVFPRDTRARN